MTFSFGSLMQGSATPNNRLFAIFYTIFRVYCGYSIAIGAGLPKVVHLIDPNAGISWHNIALGTPDWFVEQVGQIGFVFPSVPFWAILASYGEFLGGLFIAVGLFTRFSAIQMAVQFLVVSFVWYNEPELMGMYYQQLIFWSFFLIAGLGAGPISLDYWISQRKRQWAVPKSALTGMLLLFMAFPGNAQNEQPRVSFTLNNPSLRGKQLEVRGLDGAKKERIGYGCQLGALKSRSDNKPVGTRIYVKSNGQWELIYVLGSEDNGRSIDVTRHYELSREQWLQVAYDEQIEETLALENISKNPDVAGIAASLGLEMITIRFTGKSAVGKQVHVRVQLPYDQERSNNGFSRKMSMFKTVRGTYPEGTKIYLCEGPYWNGPVKETLLVTIDPEKSNYLIRL